MKKQSTNEGINELFELNKKAIELCQDNEIPEALKILKLIEERLKEFDLNNISDEVNILKSTTYNNLACIYKRFS